MILVYFTKESWANKSKKLSSEGPCLKPYRVIGTFYYFTFFFFPLFCHGFQLLNFLIENLQATTLMKGSEILWHLLQN